MPDKLTDKVNTKVINDSKENINLTCMTEQKLYTMPPADIVDLINRLQAKCDNYSHNVRTMTKTIRENQNLINELVNRCKELQAENEKLKSIHLLDEFNVRIRVDDMFVSAHSMSEWLEFCDNLKSEAYKEFAERLKIFVIPQMADGYTREIVLKRDIDNLLKELVGEDK